MSDTIVLSALNGTSISGVPSDYSSVQFFVDWKRFLKPDKSYNLQFTLMAISCNIDLTTLATLYIDLGAKRTMYSATNSYLIENDFLGVIYPSNNTTGTGYLSADIDRNPSVFLESMPTNNNITVSILNNNVPPTRFIPGTGGVMPPWVLSLKFTEV